MAIKILDPNIAHTDDSDGSHRGGGRYIQMLRENLADKVSFIASPKDAGINDTLLVPFWQPFQTAAVKKRFAQRQILTIFDVIPFKYPDKFPIGFRGKLGLIDNLNHLNHFDDFITISEASKRDIVQHLNIAPEVVHVIHLTTNTLFFDISTSQPDGKKRTDIPHLPFCLYVGDINWNKNIVNIARALKIAQMKGVFVGRAFTETHRNLDHPWLTEFKAFKKECGYDEQFVFPGYMPDKELVLYYKKALCNILVSRDEGFGLSYLEASTQKCPSVLSDVPVFNEIADTAALFADPEDPHSIAEKIVRLRDNEVLRKKLGQQSSAQVGRFKPEVFAQRMMEILSEKL